MSKVRSTTKPHNTAFNLELFGGMFGLLGLGRLYLGQTRQGLIALSWWAIWLIACYLLINLLPSRVVAVLVCLPLTLVGQIVIPFWLAIRFKRALRATHRQT